MTQELDPAGFILPPKDTLGRYEGMCDGCSYLEEEYWYHCKLSNRPQGDRINCMGCLRPEWCLLDRSE